jgi:4-hydroxy-tetrahydrodipicolinate synthase
MLKKYHGIIPPIITPVDENENVDEKGFRLLLEHCVTSGLHGIFVAGTSGECVQLTKKERMRAVKIALEQVNGRIPVLCGMMDSSTRRVIDNIKELEQMGGTCAVITPVFYARHSSQNETIRHFELIAKETSIDLVIYNIPSMTGLNLASDTVIKIGQIDNVVGYKDSGPSYGEFMKVLAYYKDKPFSCLQGVTSQAISSLLMGADGFVPVLAPLFPKIFIEAYEAGISKNVERAAQYDVLIQETSKILGFSKNLTAAAKFAISTLGFSDKRVIMPQDGTLLEEEKEILNQINFVNELYTKINN